MLLIRVPSTLDFKRQELKFPKHYLFCNNNNKKMKCIYTQNKTQLELQEKELPAKANFFLPHLSFLKVLGLSFFKIIISTGLNAGLVAFF